MTIGVILEKLCLDSTEVGDLRNVNLMWPYQIFPEIKHEDIV